MIKDLIINYECFAMYLIHTSTSWQKRIKAKPTYRSNLVS